MSPEPLGENRTTKEKQLDLGTWGVFFVWIGIALLAPLNWGVWLLGVGLIILGAQVIRRAMALGTEGFWVVAGFFFVVGGVSELSPFGIGVALIPIICILAGAGLLVKALSRRTSWPSTSG